jgi:hypothetical protein
VSSFQSIVDRFKKIEEELGLLGDKIVEGYPNSKTLIGMVSEVKIASEALATLRGQIEEALTVAEKDEGLKKEFLTKIKESELYAELKPDEREMLAEFLVQTKQDLADREMLDAYVEKSLSQKPTSDLIAMIPKTKIIEKGKSLDDGSDGFDAYSTGFSFYQKAFNDDKFAAVKELVDIWFERGVDAVIREFYAEAFDTAPTDLEEE